MALCPSPHIPGAPKPESFENHPKHFGIITESYLNHSLRVPKQGIACRPKLPLASVVHDDGTDNDDNDDGDDGDGGDGGDAMVMMMVMRWGW